MTIMGSEPNSSLIISFATFCTPPLYLREGTCIKFCQERDDQYGHYTCTPNGDKECKQGWSDPLTNCMTRQPRNCPCANGACDTNRKCVCNMGFTGMDCSEDIDECSLEPGVCEDKDNTVCRKMYGFYACDCKPGYTGSRCQFITTTESPMTTEQSVSPSSSTKDLLLPIGVAAGLLLLTILAIVLIVCFIRWRKRRMTRETEGPGTATLAVQRESHSAASNEAHSNPYVMEESTFTNKNGALPGDDLHPIYDNYTGGAVLPPYRVNEFPGPRDSLFIVDNVTYESSGNIGKVEDTNVVYAIVKK